jgi:hypothetical protein
MRVTHFNTHQGWRSQRRTDSEPPYFRPSRPTDRSVTGKAQRPQQAQQSRAKHPVRQAFHSSLHDEVIPPKINSKNQGSFMSELAAIIVASHWACARAIWA